MALEVSSIYWLSKQRILELQQQYHRKEQTEKEVREIGEHLEVIETWKPRQERISRDE